MSFNNTNQENEIYVTYQALRKYLFFWKQFLTFVTIFLIIGFLFMRYATKKYSTTAKIQIIDNEDNNGSDLVSFTDVLSTSKINLENELEVIKSTPILEEVIRNLNLTTSVFAVWDVTSSLEIDYPFKLISLLDPNDIFETLKFKIDINEEGALEINDIQNDKDYVFNSLSTKNQVHSLPFEIIDIKADEWSDKGFIIELEPIANVLEILKEEISASKIGKESEIISLEYISSNALFSEMLINELIKVFNEDGVKDRQLIHKRTIDFVNERYSYLLNELDSIEVGKIVFKKKNEVVDFEANTSISLSENSKNEESIFKVENQIGITKILISDLTENPDELLPSNLGFENIEINSLISLFNESVLMRKKLVLSAGNNNPNVLIIENEIQEISKNILSSLTTYLSQLDQQKKKLSEKIFEYTDEISELPRVEKILRSIERNQAIKESLFLFLLKKREESEVSIAITEPSIKVVENAISSNKPIYPKPPFVYFICLLLGLLLPILNIYFRTKVKTKIYSREDFEGLNIDVPVAAEIPEVYEGSRVVNSVQDRTNFAEAFRILASNLNYFKTGNQDKNNVILCTSTIKGEGKTFTAVNLAITQASLNNKVLLIGADMRNPQIHKLFEVEKNKKGLVNFLIDNSVDWKSFLHKEIKNCDILLSGAIPVNPSNLLNNGNLEILINEAKSIYDFVIIDSAPALIVSDTFSILKFASLVVYVTRSGVTEKSVLKFLSDNIDKFTNICAIINGIGKNVDKYNYDYFYNYNYSYNYKYNYGYGYGYGSEEDENS